VIIVMLIVEIRAHDLMKGLGMIIY